MNKTKKEVVIGGVKNYKKGRKKKKKGGVFFFVFFKVSLSLKENKNENELDLKDITNMFSSIILRSKKIGKRGHGRESFKKVENRIMH